MKALRYIYPLLAAAVLAAISLPARQSGLRQEDENQDESRFVRLMSAQSVVAEEVDGRNYRKAFGPARFLHNNTWLICDTALWDVEEQVIYAIGNVSIEQENTELRGDKLTYRVETNTAEFRGSLVQLSDSDGNTLRTNNLDYNTKDSVAVFRNGGAMRDKNGQLMESVNGTYEAKLKTFTFEREVEMFTDSIFIKTSKMLYYTPTQTATYPERLEAWRDDKMLSAGNGYYDRKREKFFFHDNVHLMSEDKEGWCDSLFLFRREKNLQMFGNVQVTDTVRSVIALAGKVDYRDTVSTVTLSRDPIVIMETSAQRDSLGRRDSVFLRADNIEYQAVKKNKVDSLQKASAAARLAIVEVDAVANYRAKAAEAAAKAVADAIANDPNLSQKYKKKENPAVDTPVAAPVDSVALRDSLALKDSLARRDSILLANDSTNIAFVCATGKVKIYRNGMQAVCDTLFYTDLDSMARLYVSPILWNEVRQQYCADSIFVVVRDQKMKKANLMSNAFIHVEEEEHFFNQIKSTEMMAFFSDTTSLQRFDALGGVTSLFFIKEHDRISTANRTEATMMSAEFDKDANLSKATYFESPKSNAYPIAQMLKDDRSLKGFNWVPELRPKFPRDLSSREARPSERQLYQSRPRTSFPQTEKYFKGYMAKLYHDIEVADSLRKVRETLKGNPVVVTGTAAGAAAATTAGAVAAAASVQATSLPDVAPGLSAPDSTASAAALTAKEAAKAGREKKKAERQAERERKWAELDARDAAAQAAKKARAEDRIATKEYKRQVRLMEQKAKEDALREKYKQKYLRKIQRKDQSSLR